MVAAADTFAGALALLAGTPAACPALRALDHAEDAVWAVNWRALLPVVRTKIAVLDGMPDGVPCPPGTPPPPWADSLLDALRPDPPPWWRRPWWGLRGG